MSLDRASMGEIVVPKCHMRCVDGVRLSKGEEGLIKVASLLYLFRFTMDILEPGNAPSLYWKVHSSPPSCNGCTLVPAGRTVVS